MKTRRGRAARRAHAAHQGADPCAAPSPRRTRRRGACRRRGRLSAYNNPSPTPVDRPVFKTSRKH